jgi:hypothetical protein
MDTIRIASDISISNRWCEAFANQNIVISGQLQTRIFNLTAASQLTLSRITLLGGKETTDGGAILNNGTLILENTTFKNNWQGTTQGPGPIMVRYLPQHDLFAHQLILLKSIQYGH